MGGAKKQAPPHIENVKKASNPKKVRRTPYAGMAPEPADNATPLCSGRRDSNPRPLGYEPNELPTAPLRNVYDAKVAQK